MLDGDVGSRQLDPTAATVVHHELDLVLARRAHDQDVQLLEEAETRVIILTAWHHDPEYALRLFDNRARGVVAGHRLRPLTFVPVDSVPVSLYWVPSGGKRWW
jgi:hypothetical protein